MQNLHYIEAETVTAIKRRNDGTGHFLEIVYIIDGLKWTGVIHKTDITKDGYTVGYEVKLY